MSERIDHAAEALRMAEKSDSYLRSLDMIPTTDVQAVVSQLAAVNGNLNALVHSQLALVEQQRIANLIAAVQMEGGPYRIIAGWPDAWQKATEEIKEALGL